MIFWSKLLLFYLYGSCVFGWLIYYLFMFFIIIIFLWNSNVRKICIFLVMFNIMIVEKGYYMILYYNYFDIFIVEYLDK